MLQQQNSHVSLSEPWILNKSPTLSLLNNPTPFHFYFHALQWEPHMQKPTLHLLCISQRQAFWAQNLKHPVFRGDCVNQAFTVSCKDNITKEQQENCLGRETQGMGIRTVYTSSLWDAQKVTRWFLRVWFPATGEAYMKHMKHTFGGLFFFWFFFK